MTADAAAVHELHLRTRISEAEAELATGAFDTATRALVDAVAGAHALDENLVQMRDMVDAAVPRLVDAAAAAPDDRVAVIATRQAWRSVRREMAKKFATLAAARPEHVRIELNGALAEGESR